MPQGPSPPIPVLPLTPPKPGKEGKEGKEGKAGKKSKKSELKSEIVKPPVIPKGPEPKSLVRRPSVRVCVCVL